MLRLIATTTLAASAVLTMSALEAQAGKLPATVSSQLQIATGPEQIAQLAIEHPDFSASIMEEATLLGVSTPGQIVVAALSSDASIAEIKQLTRTAAMVSPPDVGTAIASAAELCVINGGEISAEVSPAVAAAIENGVEPSGSLAEVIDSEAANILSALQGWCRQLSLLQAEGQNQLTQFRKINLDGLPSEAQNNPSPN